MTRKPLVPDERYTAPTSLPFGPDTVSWHVAREPVAFLGASTALLLQVGHPLIAAGVAQHSNYASEPWSRLYRTLDTVIKLVFGDPEMVRQMESRLTKRHAPVRGVSSSGVEYDARDAHLGLWVWGTLVETAADMFERVYGPMSPIDRERYYQEGKLFAVAAGVPEDECPATYTDFRGWYEGVLEGELAQTPESDDIARSVFVVRRPRLVGPVLGGANRLAAAAFLPPPARQVFGLTWNERNDRILDVLLRSLGLALRLVPRRARHAGIDLVVKHDVLERMERRLATRRATRRRAPRRAA